MPLTPAETEAMAAAEAVRLPFIALHTADGAAGAAAGVTRKPAGWGAPATNNGVSTVTSAELTYDVPDGTYTHYGYWSDETGGTYRGGNPLDDARTVDSGGNGQVKITVTLPVRAE